MLEETYVRSVDVRVILRENATTCVRYAKMSMRKKVPDGTVYNMIHQWYVPTKHAGMLPEQAEKMLN